MTRKPAFDLFSIIPQKIFMQLMGGMCTGCGILFICIVVDGLRQRAILDLKMFSHEHNRWSRDTDPITFWFYVITDSFMGLSCIFAGSHLLGFW